MFIVDRIEDNYAVVEFNDMFLDIPLDSFREEVKEGDVLFFSVDKEETNKRKEDNKNLLFKLFNKHSEDS